MVGNEIEEEELPSWRRTGAGRVLMAEPLKLSTGFTHLPMSALIAQQWMRPYDRAILAESNQGHFEKVISTSYT
jgi:hypothetical protein